MDARAAAKDSDAASPSPAPTAPTRVLQSRPNTDNANMTQVLVAATTTTPVLTKNAPDNTLTENAKTAEITETLEALALTGEEQTQKVESVQGDTSNAADGAKGSTDGAPETADSQQQENAAPNTVPEPFAQQLQQMAIAPVDQPDPRLIDALDHPRDRVFVIKMEKEFLDFVKNEKLEEHALPPANAYHRLLVHKMAEYYRLTHIADSSGQSVKICRGESARIPPKLLCDWPTNLQQQQQAAKAPANSTIPMVKIMRRTTPSEGGSGAPSRANSRKDGSGDSDDDNNKSSNGSNKPTTREEREAAYQEARARIFKDFVESPPETPPPKTEKKTRREQPDDFSGRSQFYPVLAPAMPHPAQFYPQQVPVYPDPNMHMPPPQQPGPPRFNPMTATFTPGAPAFSPAGVHVNPAFSPRAGYPYPQPAPQMPMYPPQLPPQNRNFYPQPPGPPRPQGMQMSYSSTGYQQPPSPQRNAPYGMPPPQQQGRGMPQMQQGPGGWNPQGGVPLNSRSTSAPGYDMGFVPGPQQAGVQPQMGPWAGQQAWGGAGMRGGRM